MMPRAYTCPLRFCSSHLTTWQAAHTCQHGNVCRYETDNQGRVRWELPECAACKVELMTTTEGPTANAPIG